MNTTPSTTGTIRAVFLDVDGTYADYGVVPDGHVRAVRAAREAGHRVLLCTGRPVSMLPDSILAAGFDGLVASAGAYVEVAGTVLVDRRFPAELAARTVAALDAHDAVYVLEAQEALHVPPAALERLRAILDAHFRQAPECPVGSSAILDAVHPTAKRAAVPFAKVSVFDSPVAMECLVRDIGGGIAVVANSVADEGRHAGELYQRGISKADGVAAVIAHLGIARENTVAVGDGANDLEMIAYAGVGIAIEGSSPEVLAVADRTAARPRQEGLVAAFAELGLY
ncbi:HAD-IIB family hydrolase [Pseudarthrobacter sp. MM222]|uniref:HAD-IIB family hydrolase n=1 Tax=Pseudarthrobacter sp. MM222 TaxID=3018929 RepID=UPI0022203963|nr:HAD family hydrolase [Pseudarthrobacter sp. MM222]CAI3803735.1 Putative bifunctional phosphatase/peptidyl-prolyl cis-trans isomerase [Pseudarthrobacter sp. MM222]